MGGGVEGLIVDCYKLGNNQYNHKHPRIWEAVKNADFTRFLFLFFLWVGGNYIYHKKKYVCI